MLRPAAARLSRDQPGRAEERLRPCSTRPGAWEGPRAARGRVGRSGLGGATVPLRQATRQVRPRRRGWAGLQLPRGGVVQAEVEAGETPQRVPMVVVVAAAAEAAAAGLAEAVLRSRQVRRPWVRQRKVEERRRRWRNLWAQRRRRRRRRRPRHQRWPRLRLRRPRAAGLIRSRRARRCPTRLRCRRSERLLPLRRRQPSRLPAHPKVRHRQAWHRRRPTDPTSGRESDFMAMPARLPR